MVAKIRSLLEQRNLTHEHLEQVFMEMDGDGNSSLDMQELRLLTMPVRTTAILTMAILTMAILTMAILTMAILTMATLAMVILTMALLTMALLTMGSRRAGVPPRAWRHGHYRDLAPA